jgi:hypothetical protein
MNLQFDTLKNIEDSCMHYAIEDITNAQFKYISVASCSLVSDQVP